MSSRLPRVRAIAGVRLGEARAHDPVLDPGQEAVGDVLPARHAGRQRRAGHAAAASRARGRPRRATIGSTMRGISSGSYWPSGCSITTTSASCWSASQVAGLLVAAVADLVGMPDRGAAAARAPARTVSSVEESSTRITSSTASCGIAAKVASSVAAAWRAGITTIDLRPGRSGTARLHVDGAAAAAARPRRRSRRAATGAAPRRRRSRARRAPRPIGASRASGRRRAW